MELEFWQDKEHFNPITIKLQTQKEVDVFLALINYSPINETLNKILGKEFDEIWHKLIMFSDDYDKYFDQFIEGIKKHVEEYGV